MQCDKTTFFLTNFITSYSQKTIIYMKYTDIPSMANKWPVGLGHKLLTDIHHARVRFDIVVLILYIRMRKTEDKRTGVCHLIFQPANTSAKANNIKLQYPDYYVYDIKTKTCISAYITRVCMTICVTRFSCLS